MPEVIPSTSVQNAVIPAGSVETAVAELREQLVGHSVYAAVDSLPRLRTFMATHVYAVWDFMSLTKRLQRDLTSTTVPWLPPKNAKLARFVNEVVLDEESDHDLNGEPASHLELYLRAMEDVGADTSVFRQFLALVSDGVAPNTALHRAGAPAETHRFVSETLECAAHGSTAEVVAYFLFGREDVIPDMFQRLLSLWDSGGQQVPRFAFYLARHIELDGGHHAQLGRQLLEATCVDAAAWTKATHAARRAIESRLRLWDGLQQRLGISADNAADF